MKNSMLKDFLIFLGINTLVSLAWMLLEIFTIGEVVPSDIDSVVGSVLSISLYANLKLFDKLKYKNSDNGGV